MRVALLTNFIPPYRAPLFREIERRCSDFRIFLSAPTEAGRSWKPDWGQLPVQMQRSIASKWTWRHPSRFSEQMTMHFPYDTIPLLMRFRPDVVVAGEMGFRTLQASLYHRLFPESALVIWAKVSEITEQGRGRLRHRLRTALLGRADAVVVNGESGANYISRFGISRDRIFLAPSTTEVQPFLSLPVTLPPELRHRLLYSGMLTERKNILPFLNHLGDWAKLNPGRQIEFHLLGDGPLRPAIAAFSGPPNLSLRLLGTATYDQLPTAYGNGGILAFPTLADEWGMVATEAMASGVPVLGSRYSQAVEELVKDGHNGWSFRPDDPIDLRSALDRALRTPATRVDQMAARARADISGTAPAAVADRMMNAFEYARRVNRHNTLT